MKKCFSYFGVLLCGILHLQAQEPGSQSVYFASGSYQISKDALIELDQKFDNQVPAKSKTQITIKGYADNKGSAHFNQVLAERRAKAVESYYLSKGISQEQIHVLNMGPVTPPPGENNETARKKSRRVDVLCYTPEPPPVSVPTPVSHSVALAEPEPKQQGLLTKEDPGSEGDDIQIFRASPKKDIKLTGKKGTVIKIPPNSLADGKGNIIRTDVVIELTEVYSQYDMLLHHLQTVSDNKLLESAGMVYLRITSQNKELCLVPKACYQIEFPTASKANDMHIFYGAGSGPSLNWKQADADILYDQAFVENQRQLDKYVFNGTKLGWINCDHFMGRENMTRLQVSLTDTVAMNLCFVLKRINSVMIIGNTKTGFQSPYMPLGETGTLLAFSLRGNEVLFVSREVTVSKNGTEALSPEKMSMDAFRDRIKVFQKR
jgi:hypothetical protein